MFDINLQMDLFTVFSKLPDGTYTEIKSWMQILATPITLVSISLFLRKQLAKDLGETEEQKARIPLKLSFDFNGDVLYSNCRKIIVKIIDYNPLERLSSRFLNFGQKIKLEQEQAEILGVLEILEEEKNSPDLEDHQQEILNDYLKHIKKLLVEQNLATKPHDDPIVEAARDLTSHTMRKLNLGQNQLITHFLSEANLIQGGEQGKEDNLPCLLKGANLEGVDLTRANLERANLEGANLKGATLKGTFLQGANLKDANLKGVRFELSYLPKTNFKGANLEKALFIEARVSGSNFEDANLKNSQFNNTILREASFSRANLESAYIIYSKLGRASFTSTNLTKAHFSSSNLYYCHFNGAKVEGLYFDTVEDINEKTKESLIRRGARFYKC